MNSIPSIAASSESYRLEKILVCFFAATILLKIQLTYASIACLFIFWSYFGRHKQAFKTLVKSPIFILLLLFYCLQMVSIFYSSNVSLGLAKLETRSALIILPLLFSGIRWSTSMIRSFVKVYIYAAFIASLYSIVSTYIYYRIDFSDMSYYSWVLPNTMGLYANYYALLITSAAIFCMAGISHYDFSIKRWQAIGLTFYFLCFVSFLSSRSALFAFLLIGLVFFLKAIRTMQTRNRILSGLAAGFFLIIAIVAASTNPYLRSRILQVSHGFDKDPRYQIFKASVAVIKENTWYGVGLGDAVPELMQQYRKTHNEEALAKEYNSHNDILQVTVTIGVIGLSCYLALLVLMIINTWKTKNILKVSFLILYFCGSMTESLLERNKGALFFALFTTCFFVLKLFDTATLSLDKKPVDLKLTNSEDPSIR